MSMFVALNTNGNLITIEDALRGLACNCTCVSCGDPVVARKGTVREHHFSHQSNTESCTIQRETLLHLYAKEVIRTALGIQLPAFPGTSPSSDDKTSWWDIESVVEEVAQPGFQPDLVATLNDGTRLFIEIAVTSFVDEEKLERIRRAGIWTVEIDLSHLRSTRHLIPSEEVRFAILDETRNKSWLLPEVPASQVAIESEPAPKCVEHRFTVEGMWISARILRSGSVAVRSWSFNPNIAQLLKSWRNELGGEYNSQYRNWIFYPRSRTTILNRLQEMNQR